MPVIASSGQVNIMSTQKFGRYVIKSEIGRGGMATVFHAYDPRFERDVAIKVLPKEFLHDPQFRVRFEREAKTIALLEHPAIVPVYDFGEEEGQPFIVMRYMSGGSMSERIQQGPISLEETVQLFNRLAPALDAAHAKGIVHRDMKPGNILFDQYGNAFLSDFGIARLAQASGTTLTGGNILGTPAYMSPEQIQGEKEIDGRSDIYSMGVILYQMLTGNAPYQSTTPVKVMMMHITEPIPQIMQAKKDLPVAIQGVLDKAMAKEPSDRFNSTAEMASTLDGILFNTTPPRGSATMVSPGLSKVGMEKTHVERRAAQTVIGAPPVAAPKKKGFPVIGVILIGLILVGIVGILAGGGFYLFTNINKPTQTLAVVAELSTPTAKPTDTSLPPTDTQTPQPIPDTDTPAPLPTETLTPEPSPVPTDTPEPTLALVLVGGADKIAFINNSEIWLANVDGSDLKQITSDGTVKTRLQWLPPDFNEIIFITGKCIKMVNADTTKVDLITCFETAAYLEDFKVSPDGKQVAISIDHEQIYIVPFNLEALKQAKSRKDLAPMGECTYFSPYGPVLAKTLAWSKDGQALAYVFEAPVGGRREDNIREISVADCVDPQVRIGVDFPAQFFDIKGYNVNPTIQNFGWDGEALFSLNGIVRNGGFGDLYFWNNENNRPDLMVNPLGSCCYRDSAYSPDGRYLIFAYQAIDAGNKIQLYYIPLGTIGTGERYSPIPLPDDFFANRSDSPEPVLRPAE
jgi:tRNA A-37 threonylcarbamoyl transferase component Bud32